MTLLHRTADYWIYDARRFGAKVIVSYGQRDGTVGVHIERFPTIDQAKEYAETVQRISTTWEAEA
tara:strand:+ start:69 stop:263 length:195 start_codon:yes stop_codon:yes gene_type:complete